VHVLVLTIVWSYYMHGTNKIINLLRIDTTAYWRHGDTSPRIAIPTRHDNDPLSEAITLISRIRVLVPNSRVAKWAPLPTVMEYMSKKEKSHVLPRAIRQVEPESLDYYTPKKGQHVLSERWYLSASLQGVFLPWR